MKQFSIILNVILLIAVGVLYYFHFKENKNSAASSSPSVPADASIVYINSDAITENYKLYIQKRSEMGAEQESIKEMLKTEGARLQNMVEEYQKKASMMSKVDRDAAEKKLARLQQELYIKRDSLTSRLEYKSGKINDQVYDHLTSFLKDYQKTKSKNYNFVLGYQKGGAIISANENLDITHEVLDALNKEYDKENPLGK